MPTVTDSSEGRASMRKTERLIAGTDYLAGSNICLCMITVFVFVNNLEDAILRQNVQFFMTCDMKNMF